MNNFRKGILAVRYPRAAFYYVVGCVSNKIEIQNNCKVKILDVSFFI